MLRMLETNILLGLVAALIGYGLSVILSDSAGPFGVFAALRGGLGILRCPYCSGFWFAAIMWLIFCQFLVSWQIFPFGVLFSWGLQIAILEMSGRSARPADP